MRDIQINSDKYTVCGVVFLLAVALLVLRSDLHALTSHHPASDDVRFWDYAVAIFNIYAAVVICRDTKLRTNYPLGVAGVCLMVLVLLVRIVAHWEKESPETQNLLWKSMTVVGIASSSLILGEVVRWFRRNVTLV